MAGWDGLVLFPTGAGQRFARLLPAVYATTARMLLPLFTFCACLAAFCAASSSPTCVSCALLRVLLLLLLLQYTPLQ